MKKMAKLAKNSSSLICHAWLLVQRRPKPFSSLALHCCSCDLGSASHPFPWLDRPINSISPSIPISAFSSMGGLDYAGGKDGCKCLAWFVEPRSLQLAATWRWGFRRKVTVRESSGPLNPWHVPHNVTSGLFVSWTVIQCMWRLARYVQLGGGYSYWSVLVCTSAHVHVAISY